MFRGTLKRNKRERQGMRASLSSNEVVLVILREVCRTTVPVSTVDSEDLSVLFDDRRFCAGFGSLALAEAIVPCGMCLDNTSAARMASWLEFLECD